MSKRHRRVCPNATKTAFPDRIAAEVALTTLLRRIPNLRIDDVDLGRGTVLIRLGQVARELGRGRGRGRA